MDQEKIGKFIADLRRQKGMTQLQLAEKLRTSVKTISRWETGITVVNITYIKELCNIFGINENELLNGERSNKKNNEKINEDKRIKRSGIKEILLLTIIMFLVLLIVIMTIHNTKQNYVYFLKSTNTDYSVNGIVIKTPESKYLIITDIDTKLDDFGLYSYQYKLYSDNNLIYQEGDISSYRYHVDDKLFFIKNAMKNTKIYVEEEIIMSNLSLEMIYIDKNLEEKKIVIPIKLKSKATNMK